MKLEIDYSNSAQNEQCNFFIKINFSTSKKPSVFKQPYMYLQNIPKNYEINLIKK